MRFKDWVTSQSRTRAQVAKSLGISRDALQKIMRGERLPQPGTRAAISRESQGEVTASDLLAANEEYRAAHPPRQA